MIQRTSPIEGPQYKSPEWYAARKLDPEAEVPIRIGASNAAACCNVSAYSDALTVYARARGEIGELEFDDETKDRLETGLRLEPVIVDMYSERRDCVVTRGLPMFFSSETPVIGATPDGIGQRKDDEWLVEAKNSNFRMFSSDDTDDTKFGEEGTDQIPRDYLWQAHQQMYVMGIDHVEFPVLKNGSKLMIYEVDRVEPIVEMIIKCETELAERIVAGDPPDPNFQLEGTKSLIHELYGVQVGTVVELTTDDEALWHRREELSKLRKELNTEYDAVTAELMWNLGDAEKGFFPDGGGVKKTVVKESYVTQQMVDKLADRVGEVHRKGHTRLYKI